MSRVPLLDPASALQAVAAAVDQRGPGTCWVGVDGRGASGKTTFANALAAALPDVDIVHVDDFGGPGVTEWDWPRFAVQVAAPLCAGRAARYQRWGWAAGSGGDWVDLSPGRVLVVEGGSSTRVDVTVPWHLRIWVDAPREVRLRRLRQRDGAALASRWEQDWLPSEERYVARDQPRQRADLLVDGSVVTAAGSALGQWTR